MTSDTQTSRENKFHHHLRKVLLLGIDLVLQNGQSVPAHLTALLMEVKRLIPGQGKTVKNRTEIGGGRDYCGCVRVTCVRN